MFSMNMTIYERSTLGPKGNGLDELAIRSRLVTVKGKIIFFRSLIARGNFYALPY